MSSNSCKPRQTDAQHFGWQPRVSNAANAWIPARFPQQLSYQSPNRFFNTMAIKQTLCCQSSSSLLLMDPSAPKRNKPFSDDPVMTVLGIARRSPDLLHNCDLPPPLKLLSPLEEHLFVKGGDNPGLLRALILSQTRTREAEERAEVSAARIAHLAAVLLEQSVRLSAHRRWMMMLEIEISALRKRASQPTEKDCNRGDGAGGIAWCLAVVLCFGIAGVGFAWGRCLC